jgi:predicted lipoprotein with Yx(FWY)xxD motif
MNPSHPVTASVGARQSRGSATRRLIAGLALGVSVLGGLIVGTGPADAQSSTTTAAPKTIKLGVANTKLGDVIVDGNGMTLYMFAPDRYNVSVCEGQCLAAWPPVMLAPGTSTSDVELSGNLRKSKLGVAMRENGSRQLTYNGWALYYWFRDSKAGDVNGQWVNNAWWVLSEEGVPNSKRL